MEDLRSARAPVRFGPFELDRDAEELRKNGIKIRLQEQPLQILEILRYFRRLRPRHQQRHQAASGSVRR